MYDGICRKGLPLDGGSDSGPGIGEDVDIYGVYELGG